MLRFRGAQHASGDGRLAPQLEAGCQRGAATHDGSAQGVVTVRPARQGSDEGTEGPKGDARERDLGLAELQRARHLDNPLTSLSCILHSRQAACQAAAAAPRSCPMDAAGLHRRP